MLPGPERWLFSLKTFAAAMLALSICLWLDLYRPYWAVATVYIASHPLSGATRSKAVFRALGTLLGSAAAILLVPNLASAPVLLVLAMALWSALCLYIALLDRTPRSYVFMLAGYTAALIGLPTVDAPNTIFDIALSRTEEILIGILCAAIVSNLVFPRRVGPVIALKLKNWFHHADTRARDALLLEQGRSTDMHRLRLAADTIEIENLASFLSFDATKDASATQWIRQLQPRMLMLLSILSSISDRLRELAALGGPSRPAEGLLTRARLWLEDGQPHDPVSLNVLRQDIGAEIDGRDAGGSWGDLIELGFLLRLRDFVELRADCASLAGAVRSGSASLPAPLLFPIEERIARVKHLDHGFAAFAAGVNAITICLCCSFWIFAGWSDGYSAAMMAAVASSLFASQDDPSPAVTLFAKLAAASTPVAAIYLFGFLPNIHSIETLILALAPAFLAFGLLISTPRTALIGLCLAVNSASLMALQETYAADAAVFMNSSVAMVFGMGLAACVSAVLITLGAEWGVWRISRSTGRRLRRRRTPRPRTKKRSSRVSCSTVCCCLLRAPPRRAAPCQMCCASCEPALTSSTCIAPSVRCRPLHAGGRCASYRSDEALSLGSGACAAELLEAIDSALAAIRDENPGNKRDGLLGLVGLRRCLFPKAPPPLLPKLLEAAA